jgi:hypothetical protein
VADIKRPQNGSNVKFVSASLTVERRAALTKFKDDWSDESLIAYLQECSYDMYRFGLKGEDVGFSASLTSLGKGQSKANEGFMLIERGSTPIRAIMRLFWAHNELFEKQWPKESAQTDEDW